MSEDQNDVPEEVTSMGIRSFQQFLTERIQELDEAIEGSKKELDVLEDKIVTAQLKTLFTEIDQMFTEIGEEKSKDTDGE
jgi:CHASE3 domain sensor protein